MWDRESFRVHISYCEKCGGLVQTESIKVDEALLCADCTAGNDRKPRRTRDSGQIRKRVPNSERTMLKNINKSMSKKSKPT